MSQPLTTLRKCAFGFALLFLFVYSLDYVPGIMAPNGKMFGLFSMTTFVDIGHLGLGLLALISGLPASGSGSNAASVAFMRRGSLLQTLPAGHWLDFTFQRRFVSHATCAGLLSA